MGCLRANYIRRDRKGFEPMKNQVRICVIGAGRVGKNHTRIMTQRVPGGNIVAVVDPVTASRQEMAAEYGIAAQFDSLEQALDQCEFEAVIITTPTPTHSALACQAAQHGKHVFLEKPMALSLAECDQIIQATQKHRVLLQVGFMRRFDPEFAAAASRIQNGEIGTPMMIKIAHPRPGTAASLGARPKHLQRHAGRSQQP